jgi:hypothetical protein
MRNQNRTTRIRLASRSVAWIAVMAALLAGCSERQMLPFAVVKASVPAFTEDTPATSTVMRVDGRIQETINLPAAKLSEIENCAASLKKDGWRQMDQRQEVNSVRYILRKGDIQIVVEYSAGRGGYVQASRDATASSQDKSP